MNLTCSEIWNPYVNLTSVHDNNQLVFSEVQSCHVFLLSVKTLSLNFWTNCSKMEESKLNRTDLSNRQCSIPYSHNANNNLIPIQMHTKSIARPVLFVQIIIFNYTAHSHPTMVPNPLFPEHTIRKLHSAATAANAALN